MKQFLRIVIVSLALAAAELLGAQLAWAGTTWSVSQSGWYFNVTRPTSLGKATVLYRTVGISALDGKHIQGANGILYFENGESTKQVLISQNSFADIPVRYRYQATRNFYYDFEVMDQQGVILASSRKTMSSGGDTNNPYYLNGYKDYVNWGNLMNMTHFGKNEVVCSITRYHDSSYTPPSSDVESSGDYKGYALIDDSWDYTRKAATASPGYLYGLNRAGATGEWHKLAGNKLYASVVFTEKEKDDGYGYVQVLIGDANTAYDEGYDPNAHVNTPVNSIYKACFELKKGSGAYSGSGKWIFPHSSDAHNISEETGDGSSAFWMEESYLWEQKFRSESYRAGNNNNAFILDPDISALTVRFDCGGSGDDTYGYKDFFVRWVLQDNAAPTPLTDEITVSPGPHLKGNKVVINVPFSEPAIISYENRYILSTTWGTLYADEDCSYSNVISFSGNITADPGTTLSITGLSTTTAPGYACSTIKPIKDLVNNTYTGSFTKTFSGLTVDQSYTISYNLAGGSTSVDNLSSYTRSIGPITLVNPTRSNCVFAGWTGTGLSTPTMTVTIPAGSTGDRTYTATWLPTSLSLSQVTVFGRRKYATTFYDGTNDFRLPEGAKAYTVIEAGNGRFALLLVGNDGRVIPHGTGVIVLADSNSINLTRLDSTTVTARDGNVLIGTDVELPRPGRVYVLNQSGGTMGFYPYYESVIPANKTYVIIDL